MFAKTDDIGHALRGIEAIDSDRDLCLVSGHRNADNPRWHVLRYDATSKRAVHDAERYTLRADDLDGAIVKLNGDSRTVRAVARKFGADG